LLDSTPHGSRTVWHDAAHKAEESFFHQGYAGGVLIARRKL